VQACGDSLAVQAADHQPQHLALPAGQLRERRHDRVGDRAGRRAEQRAEQAGREPRPAEHGSPDRGHDVLGRAVLGHEARRAGLESVDRRRGVGVGGQHHHHRRGGLCHELSGELDAVAVAELHVHDHRAGPVRPCHADDLAGVADSRHRLEIRLRAEERLQALGEDLVIIDDEQPDRAHMPTARCSRCQPPVSTSPSLTA
jgi:hypothetical protein